MGLSLVKIVQGGAANPPSSIVWGTTVPSGDALVAECTTESGDPLSMTFSDTINGTYNAIGTSRQISGTPYSHGAAWVTMQSPGNPTISVGLGSNKFGYIIVYQVTGFIGGAALDVALTNWNADNSGTATVATIGCVNNFYPEFCIAVFYSSGGSGQFGASTAGWTKGIGSGTTNYPWYQIPSGVNITDNFANTMNSAQKYAGMVMGLYDLPVGLAPLPRQLYIMG